MPLIVFTPKKSAQSLSTNIKRLKAYFPASSGPSYGVRGGTHGFWEETLRVKNELRDPTTNVLVENHSELNIVIQKPILKNALPDGLSNMDHRKDVQGKLEVAMECLREIENKNEEKEIKEIKEVDDENETITDKETKRVYRPSDYKGEYKTYQKPDKKQSTQFIQNLLHCVPSIGKISRLATCDLDQWILSKPACNNDLFREIIAQMLMGVHGLHSNGEIHRDIKLPNFLIYVFKNSARIELSDIDTVSDIHVQSHTIYTVPYLSPESKFVIKPKNGKEHVSIDQEKYPHLNKKPIDCYALGYGIKKLKSAHKNDYPHFSTLGLTDAFKRQLFDLSEKLTLEDPGCDLALVSLPPDEKIDESVLKNARETKTPLLMEQNGKYCIYGDPKKDGHWGYTDIEVKEDDAVSKLPFDKPKIRRDDDLFNKALIDAIKPGHADMDARFTIEQAMDHELFGKTPEIRKKYLEDIRKKHPPREEYYGSRRYLRSRRDFFTVNDSFFILSDAWKEIYLQADSLDNQMSALNLVFNATDFIYIQKTINNLKKSLNSLSGRDREGEFREILRALKQNTMEAENFLSSFMVASYFSKLEEEKNNQYILEENDEKLFHFLNQRTDEQKKVDLRAALLAIEAYIDNLKPADDHIRKLLLPYWHEVKNQRSKIPIKELPHVTELTYRILFKAQNIHSPLNAEGGANTRRGLSVAKKITGWDRAETIKNLVMALIGGVLVVGAVLTLMASFGTGIHLSVALGYIGIKVSAFAITSFISSNLTTVALVSTGAIATNLIGFGITYKGTCGLMKTGYMTFKAPTVRKKANSALRELEMATRNRSPL